MACALLSARRVERAIAGLWAMRGSKRSYKGGGQVRPLTLILCFGGFLVPVFPVYRDEARRVEVQYMVSVGILDLTVDHDVEIFDIFHLKSRLRSGRLCLLLILSSHIGAYVLMI